MSKNVTLLLDKAIVIHKLSSDYKLALVMGVSHNTLSSYRNGKTLPDARVISKICALTGDDPALLLAEIEAERAKTDEARTLWLQVVQRLQAGIAAAIFAVVTLGAVGVGFSTEAHAKPAPVLVLHPLYIVECLRVIVHRWRARFARYIRGFFLIASHV
jgi:transcriptional regulator with XRE-family HTH domain